MSSFARLRMRHYKHRSLARDRQARLIGWAPTAQKCRGHCVAILHGKLGWGVVMVWWVGLPKLIDLAKIGLANGQPGSDTKFVTTGFPGINF